MTVEINKRVLHFQLFGTPAVFFDGRGFNIPRKTVRLMAYYLASQSVPTARKDLMLLFWPDETEQKAAANVREHLSKLRSSLPDRNLLTANRDLAYFDSSQTSSDVLLFKTNGESLKQQLALFSSTSPLPESVMADLEATIALWQSNEFLSINTNGQSDVLEEWLRDTRQDLEMLFSHLVERTAESFLNHRNFTKAIEYLNKIVTVDNLNTMLHYRLLRSLLDAQQYPLARSYCDYIQDVFESAGLDLESGILSSLVKEVQEEKTLIPSDEDYRWQQRFQYQLPYVGHETDFDVLRANLNKGIFLFHGETGIGRSRMAYEFYRRYLHHYRPLQTESHHFEELMPYVAIMDIIKTHTREEEWQQLPPENLCWFTNLYPPLLLQFPSLPPKPNLSAADIHQEIMQAMLSLFLVLAKDQPLCMVFDDIHFSDNASLLVLRYLYQHGFFPQHGCLILTADTDFHHAPKFQFLGLDPSKFHNQPVSSLTGNDFNNLINSVIGHPVSDAAIHMLIRESKGNTLIGITTIMAAVNQKLKNFEDIETILAQRNLSFPGWANQQLADLSDEEKDILEISAMMGNHVTSRQLEVSLGKDAAEVNSILSRLIERNIITEQREDDILYGYNYTHPLLHQMMIEKIPGAKKRELSSRIVDAYYIVFENHLDRVASILAQHHLNAGQPFRAWEQFSIAAQNAEQLYAPDDANEAYSMAENLLFSILEQFDDESIANFYTKWVRDRIAFNFLEEAQAKVNTLLKIGEQRQSHHILGVAYFLKGLSKSVSLLALNSPLADYEQSLQHLQYGPECRTLWECKTEKALALLTSDRTSECRQLVEEVINAIDQKGVLPDWMESVQLRARYVYALLLCQTGKFKEAYQNLNVSRQKSLSGLDSVIGLNFLNLHAWISYHFGLIDVAEPEFAEVIDLARRLNNQIVLSTALDTAGRMNFFLGKFDTAWEQLSEAVSLAKKNNLSHIAASAYISRGILLRSFSAYPQAKEEFLNAIHHAKSHTNALTLNASSVYLALIEADLGKFPQTLEMLQALVTDFRNTGAEFLRLQTEVNLYYQCVTYDPDEIYSGPIEQEIKFLLHEVESRNLALLLYNAQLILAIYSHRHGNESLAINLVHQCIRLGIDQKLNVLELFAYMYLHQFSGALDVPIQERIRYLILDLQENLKHPEISELGAKFIENIQKLIETP